MHRQRRRGILKNDSHYLNTFNNVELYTETKRRKRSRTTRKPCTRGVRKEGACGGVATLTQSRPSPTTANTSSLTCEGAGTNISTWHLIDIVSMWEAGLITHHKKYLLFIRKYFMITSEYIMILFINYITFFITCLSIVQFYVLLK